MQYRISTPNPSIVRLQLRKRKPKPQGRTSWSCDETSVRWWYQINPVRCSKRKLELSKFLNEHNIDIATITEIWLKPSDNFKLITPTERTGLQLQYPGGGVLITIRNDISDEHTPQPKLTNIKFLSIKLKQWPSLTIGAAYLPLKTKITNTELDAITRKSGPGYFLIGGDYNAKHKNWNNLNRNANGSTINKLRTTQLSHPT